LNINKSVDDRYGIGKTKTRKERVIYLSEDTLEVLKTHQAAILEEQLNLHSYWNQNDLMFPSNI
jgi:integrase